MEKKETHRKYFFFLFVRNNVVRYWKQLWRRYDLMHLKNVERTPYLWCVFTVTEICFFFCVCEGFFFLKKSFCYLSHWILSFWMSDFNNLRSQKVNFFFFDYDDSSEWKCSCYFFELGTKLWLLFLS